MCSSDLGKLAEGTTATDLVLTVTEKLRKKGVVGKFVEFYGPGVAALSLADRATIANMAPEYGATCGFFPVDGETLRYLRESGRDEWRVALVEVPVSDGGERRRTPEQGRLPGEHPTKTAALTAAKAHIDRIHQNRRSRTG